MKLSLVGCQWHYDYITTQKTKKQDWKEAKRHIEKEVKERNTFYNLWEPKKKEEGGGGTWCGVATTTTKTCWWWRQRKQEIFLYLKTFFFFFLFWFMSSMKFPVKIQYVFQYGSIFKSTQNIGVSVPN